jgi:hypothetical protein
MIVEKFTLAQMYDNYFSICQLRYVCPNLSKETVTPECRVKYAYRHTKEALTYRSEVLSQFSLSSLGWADFLK